MIKENKLCSENVAAEIKHQILSYFRSNHSMIKKKEQFLATH